MSTTQTMVDIKVGHASPQLPKDMISLNELGPTQFQTLIDDALEMKEHPEKYSQALAGKQVILLFEKPSLRTRVSLQVGLAKLGANALYFDHADSRIGERESIKDYAQNLDRWVDCIIARTHSHATICGLAEHASVPVVNALSDLYHPCQAIADYATMREWFGEVAGLRVAYIGDGNNVCHSLLIGAALGGVDFVAITPKGFEPQFGVLHDAMQIAKQTGAKVTVTHDLDAVAGAQVVYTDAWVSMGQSEQASFRKEKFAGFQVDAELMAEADKGAIFMHCLPAHRGIEVTDDVIDSERSVVYQQAENRMHTQNALLVTLLNQAAINTDKAVAIS